MRRRKQRARRPHGLAGREIDVVIGNPQLSRAHPELEQARIDVHEGGPFEARQQIGLDGVIEIQQQIGVAEDLFRFGL